MVENLYTLRLRTDLDVVFARQRAGQIAAILNFDTQDQTRISTAVSEVARHAFECSGGGTVSFRVVQEETPSFCVEIQYRAKMLNSGDEDALVGARRLMDKFRQEDGKAGKLVVLTKNLPLKALSDPKNLTRIAAELTKLSPNGVLDEMQRHNQEMLDAMEELQSQKQQLMELNRELEDTNRGVVALYAELDERAELLAKSNEIKTRFLSNTGHELRTPLNAILSLTSLLLARSDGELSLEQERQVKFIRGSAQTLADLVNDLLDLARVESGKVMVRPEAFEVGSLFGALRGTMRPLVPDTGKVNLVFEELGEFPTLFTDEGKVSQVLRNFISNALKFTAEGEVRVTVRSGEEGWIIFEVADTGIGISPENLDYVFEEFSQVETPLHKKSKGTGLGLPLARKLAQLLGGEVSVVSEVGKGSKFGFALPCQYQGEDEVEFSQEKAPAAKPVASQSVIPEAVSPGGILIIDNEPAHRYVLKARLQKFAVEILEAESGEVGLEIAINRPPELIFLDLVMPGMDGFQVLEKLGADPRTSGITTVVHTSKRLSEGEKKDVESKAAALLPKDLPEAESLEQLSLIWKRVRSNAGGDSAVD